MFGLGLNRGAKTLFAPMEMPKVRRYGMIATCPLCTILITARHSAASIQEMWVDGLPIALLKAS